MNICNRPQHYPNALCSFFWPDQRRSASFGQKDHSARLLSPPEPEERNDVREDEPNVGRREQDGHRPRGDELRYDRGALCRLSDVAAAPDARQRRLPERLAEPRRDSARGHAQRQSRNEKAEAGEAESDCSGSETLCRNSVERKSG